MNSLGFLNQLGASLFNNVSALKSSLCASPPIKSILGTSGFALIKSSVNRAQLFLLSNARTVNIVGGCVLLLMSLYALMSWRKCYKEKTKILDLALNLQKDFDSYKSVASETAEQLKTSNAALKAQEETIKRQSETIFSMQKSLESSTDQLTGYRNQNKELKEDLQRIKNSYSSLKDVVAEMKVTGAKIAQVGSLIIENAMSKKNDDGPSAKNDPEESIADAGSAQRRQEELNEEQSRIALARRMDLSQTNLEERLVTISASVKKDAALPKTFKAIHKEIDSLKSVLSSGANSTERMEAAGKYVKNIEKIGEKLKKREPLTPNQARRVKKK